MPNLMFSAASLMLILASPTVDVEAQSNGDVICVDGFIMDRYCIDRGTLLDDPDTQTLRAPERHSIHCLVDVGVCRRSPFHILERRSSSSYREGWSVTDNGPLINLARKVGDCSTCDDGGRQRSGFKAAVRGVVEDSGDKVLRILEVAETGTDLCSNRPEPTDPPTPRPTRAPVMPPPATTTSAAATTTQATGTLRIVGNNGSPSAAFPLQLCQGDCDSDDECGPGLVCIQRENDDDPVSIYCEGTLARDNDYCIPDETLLPSITESASFSNDTAIVDCSEYQHELQVPGLNNVKLQYVVNYYHDGNNSNTMVNSMMAMDDETVYGTLSVRIEYKGQGWIGFAVSEKGEMVGSDAVLGVPSEDGNSTNGDVQKYHLTFDGASGYLLLGEEQQTLMDASIAQDDDSTVLEFTKLLVEEGEIPINGTGFNYFLVAHGTDRNELGYHGTRGRATFSLTLSPCMGMGGMMMNEVAVGKTLDLAKSKEEGNSATSKSQVEPASDVAEWDAMEPSSAVGSILQSYSRGVFLASLAASLYL